MINSILTLCEQQGFLKNLVFSKLNITQLKIGPVGLLLLQNLKQEWFYNVVLNKDTSVFLSEANSFQETAQFAKRMCLEKLPFGIAEVIPNGVLSGNERLEYYRNVAEMKNEVDFGNCFEHKDRVNLRCTLFSTPSESVQLFHQWQRQRRIWWRKFSPNPSRYSLTDIKTSEGNDQMVNIVAQYPWKPQIVESIKLDTQPRAMDKFKMGKKIVQPHCIVSNIETTVMLLNTICDAYFNPEYKGNKRTLFRFHRKLAPYSVSFSISSSATAATNSELNDLALYLNKQLRNNQVSTLLLPSSSKFSLEAQWKQYDELGIPYTIQLNEKTLKDGLILLRNRDTTLKEKVHVSELVPYIQKLLKNY